MADEIPKLTTSTRDRRVTITPTLSLRPVEERDEPLLVRIFAESHCAGFELLGLEPAALAGLVGMQFQARRAQYRMYPGATEYLIRRGIGSDGVPVGTCWLSDSPEQLRVLDFAVLAEYRRHGIARTVLGELCAQAARAGRSVGLSVWHQNAPARELYRVLGFRPDPTVRGGEGGQPGEPGDLGNGYVELLYSCRDVNQDRPEAAAQHRVGAR